MFTNKFIDKWRNNIVNLFTNKFAKRGIILYQLTQDIEIVRELLELTTEEMAKEIGVSRITLNNWLTGKRKISELNLEIFYNFAFRSGIRLNKIKEQLYKEELSEKQHVLLFHGAKNIIEGPISVGKSRKNNDFGQGFYCGENLEQSAMFVSAFSNSSLYMLDFNREGLNYKKYNVDREWMLTIAYYRERLGEFANSEIIAELIGKNKDIDYFIAPIADNRMFEIIDSFIDGEITDVQCQHCLSATNLGNQYVFVSQKAINQIRMLEHCFLAQEEKEYYLNSRKEFVEINRDKVKIARRQYRGKGKYIEEILQ